MTLTHQLIASWLDSLFLMNKQHNINNTTYVDTGTHEFVQFGRHDGSRRGGKGKAKTTTTTTTSTPAIGGPITTEHATVVQAQQFCRSRHHFTVASSEHSPGSIETSHTQNINNITTPISHQMASSRRIHNGRNSRKCHS